jgi:hypothetical protein
MLKKSNLLIAAALFALSISTFGQKTLEKSYHTWTKDEALKILNGQPFSDKYQSENGVAAVAGQVAAADQADQRIGSGPQFRTSRTLGPAPVVIRLQSSLPLRQAIVRLQEIQAGYDKMSEDDRKKFDGKVAEMLNCKICTNYYVVTMFKFKNSGMGVVDHGLFQDVKPEDMKGKVWLENDKGERRDVEQFTPANGAGDLAVFFFRRFDESGKLLVTPENKSFKIAFSTDLRNSRTIQDGGLVPSAFEFKVSKMIVNEQVAF